MADQQNLATFAPTSVSAAAELLLTMRSHDFHNTQKPVRTSSVSSWRVLRHRGTQCIYQLIVCRRLVQQQPNLLPQAFNLHVNSEAAINTYGQVLLPYAGDVLLLCLSRCLQALSIRLMARQP